MITFKLLLLAFAIVAAPCPAPRCEYCVVREIVRVDDEIDEITVINARGDMFAYFADTHTVMGGDVVSVTMNNRGEIIDAVVAPRNF